MNSAKIRREMESFQNSVKMLSSGIKQSGAEWNDDKYKELSGLVRNVASSSKQVIVAGDQICETIDRFKKIAEEEC